MHLVVLEPKSPINCTASRLNPEALGAMIEKPKGPKAYMLQTQDTPNPIYHIP